jgi:GPH family glycoside/pentoside/hexuronide:cation symporter
MKRWLIKLFYGLGSIAFGVKDNGFQVLLLIYYNQVLGLDARLAGLAIMIALVVDAVVDPSVGYLSDRLQSRLGRRHPFMYAAAVPVSLSYLLLFSPPSGLTQGPLFAYLLGVAVFVRICISFYEIPSSALVAELTTAYDERTSFLAFRYFFGWVSGLSMSILAFSVFLQPDAQHPIGFFNPAGYQRYGEVAAAVMFVSIMISSIGTQSAVLRFEHSVAASTRRPRGMFREILDTVGTPSALAALLAGILLLLATALTFGLNTYFNIYAWQFNPRQISILTSSLFLSATFSLLLAPWIARRFDKRGAALRVTALLLLMLPAPLTLSALGLIPHDPAYTLPGLFIYGAILTTLLIIVPTLLASMLADVVEEIELRTGRRDEGVVFAMNTFVQKCATGLGVFGSSAILAFARFPDHAVAGAVAPEIIQRLSLTYSGAVLLLYVGSAVCIGFYRITRAQHALNLQLLAARRAAS